MKDAGIEVKIADTAMTAFIRRADLSRDRSEQRPDRFAAGEKVDARVTNIDKKALLPGLTSRTLYEDFRIIFSCSFGRHKNNTSLFQ